MSDEFDWVDDGQLDDEAERELREFLDGFFERPLEKAEEFDWEAFKRNEAFKAIMMPSKLFWVLANFERSFTQKLGGQMYEDFSEVIANANESVGVAETDHMVEEAEITEAQERKIESIITALDKGKREPDWESEKEEVIDAGTRGDLIQVRTNWDLWIRNYRGEKPLAAEIKTPKPNKDQTMEAKRKMLKTIAAFEHRDEPSPIVRYVFPFNPYGSLEEYNHWAAKKIFDVENEDGMLIADNFWDSIGGEGAMNGLFKLLLEESQGNIEKLGEIVKGSQTDSNSNLNDFISEE